MITKDKIRVVTICDVPPMNNYYCYNEFLLSLQARGVFPLILGTKQGEYKGLVSKPKLLLEAIEKGIIKEKYIIFADCFDLVFQAEVETIIEAFEKISNFTGCKIVISAEKNCFPTDLKEQFDSLTFPEKTDYKYLNSGFIVAKTSDLRDLLVTMNIKFELDDHEKPDGSWYHSNDQFLYQKAFINNPGLMFLDYGSVFSWCMQNVEPNEVQYGMFDTVQPIGSSFVPMTIHWNGGSKSAGTMDPILKHLKLR